MGLGMQELAIIFVIVVLLFGAPVLTFLLGYLVGRKSSRAPECETTPNLAEESARVEGESSSVTDEEAGHE